MSRADTEQRLLGAVETLLLEQGFPAVGVNAVARSAGCDKVLIYRYFGGFDGLLERFAGERDLWWDLDEIIEEDMDRISQYSLAQYLELLLRRHIQALRKRPLTQEILAWELSADNPLTRALHRQRSERGQQLVKQIRHLFQQPGIDIGGILGIFGAAINYLVIRTRHRHSEYEKEEWWRLEQSIAGLLSCRQASS